MKKKNKKVSGGLMLGAGVIVLVLVVAGVVSASGKDSDGYLGQANSWLMAAVGASKSPSIIYGTPDQYEATEVKDLKKIPSEPIPEAGVVRIKIRRPDDTKSDEEKTNTITEVHTIHQPTDVDFIKIVPPSAKGKMLLVEAFNAHVPLRLQLLQVKENGSIRSVGYAKEQTGTYEYLVVKDLDPSGKYYLKVAPAKKISNYQEAEYELYITKSRQGSKDSPRSITEDKSTFGAFIDPTEEHWFHFDARKGQNYSIFTSELDSKIDTAVELYELDNSKVKFIKSDDNSYFEPRASVIEWNAEGDKKMLVRVKNKTKKFATRIGIMGQALAYKITVETDGLPADGEGADVLELLKNKEGPISESGTIGGNSLNNRLDVDNFPLGAKNKGDTFAINLISESSGFKPSMILYKLVEAKDGELSVRFEKSGDSSIDFIHKDASEAVYFISVYDKNKKAPYAKGSDRKYRLEITYSGAPE